MQYAAGVVDKVWQAAQVVGYGSRFPQQLGVSITDDHIPVNTVAKIPCIDIIPYYPDCEQSSFGPTWHTVNDTMDHIDKSTLQAVGQTVIQVLFSEHKLSSSPNTKRDTPIGCLSLLFVISSALLSSRACREI